MALWRVGFESRAPPPATECRRRSVVGLGRRTRSGPRGGLGTENVELELLDEFFGRFVAVDQRRDDDDHQRDGDGPHAVVEAERRRQEAGLRTECVANADDGTEDDAPQDRHTPSVVDDSGPLYGRVAKDSNDALDATSDDPLCACRGWCLSERSGQERGVGSCRAESVSRRHLRDAN